MCECKKMFLDRKSTRLNSSHLVISYAVFCLKKKKNSLVGRQNVGHVGRRHIAPFDVAMFPVQHRGFGVGPLNLSDWFASYFFFFFNNPATPEIYTLSLHDALPI